MNVYLVEFLSGFRIRKGMLKVDDHLSLGLVFVRIFFTFLVFVILGNGIRLCVSNKFLFLKEV